jgi:23S rRNA (adenine2503-C2)-methyltransferase
MTRRDLAELDPAELEAALAILGAQRFHARQIYGWVHKRGVTDFAQMTDLSRELRHLLDATCTVVTPKIARKDVSIDGTAKYLLELADGHYIEAVYIPDTPAQTFCISSQVGCAMGCGFCLTGKMGIVRNLTAGEIVGQVRVLANDLQMLDKAFNIVLMGMGEPLHNYEAVMKALRMLGSEHGLEMSPKRMTLSTVGVVPGIQRLALEEFMPNLAISLHATTDEQRSAIVPINRKYNLAQLLAACRAFPLKKRSRLTFEYVMLADVNDTHEDAKRLVKLLNGIRAKVNLLPLNEAPGIPFRRPSDEHVDRFARFLSDHDVNVTVRKSRGRDIRAACGQLIIDGPLRTPRTPGQRLAAAMNPS